MNAVLLITFLALLSATGVTRAGANEEAPTATAQANVKTLNTQNSVREIVKDLIENWNSPLVYLRHRGYLQAPQLDFNMVLKAEEPQTAKATDKVQRTQRAAAAVDTSGDLGAMFRTFFSTSDMDISDKIKSKLGVAWDMKALKNSVSNEANKYYEEFYNKRNHDAAEDQEGVANLDVEREVAKLYPSLLPNAGQAQPQAPAAHKETKFLHGIAKLLSKPLPLRVKDDASPA